MYQLKMIRMKKYFYPVIFEPEDIGVSVYVPDIPGCFTQGDSLEEALDYIADDELAEITPESIRLRKADLTRTRFN